MARQIKAERDKRASILQAEGNKRAVILEAESRKHPPFLDDKARKRQDQAEARATQMVSKAISEKDVKAINYFIAKNTPKPYMALPVPRTRKWYYCHWKL